MRLLGIFVIVLIFYFSLFISSGKVFAQEIICAERQDCENKLADLEKQIEAIDGTISEYQKQGKTLQGEIDRSNAKISKLDLQIKATRLSLKKLDQEVDENEDKIENTEADLELNRKALAGSLQSVYENENISLIAMLLKNSKLSDFFGDINNLIEVQNSLTITLQEIIDLKSELLEEKEMLALKKTDIEALKAYQSSQQSDLKNTKKEKGNLLAVTKGKESVYQELLKETKKTAAQIRSQIFQLLGGGELTFEKAYEFAKLAEKSTGVRAAFILAILDRESALGQNVGRCSYKTAMAPGPPRSKRNDVASFLQIVGELRLNPDTMLVSCANADGAYGGAMGPAQFIPTTWMLYRDGVSEITGSRPANPWNNADAFVAAALYLKDAGAAANERTAAARYYCGSRWNRYTCLNVYAAKVVEKARKFEQDINILNS